MFDVIRPKRRLSRYRWGCWITLFIIIGALVEAGYPAYRQHQLIAELERKGYEVKVVSPFSDGETEWLSMCGLTFGIAFAIEDKWVTSHADGNLKSIRELITRTYYKSNTLGTVRLFLERSRITDQGLSYLRDLPQLRSLGLVQTW